MIRRRPLAPTLLAALFAAFVLAGCQKEEAKKPGGIPEKFRITVTIYLPEKAAKDGPATLNIFRQFSNGCMPFDREQFNAFIGPYNCIVVTPPLFDDAGSSFFIGMVPLDADRNRLQVVIAYRHRDMKLAPYVDWKESDPEYRTTDPHDRTRAAALYSAMVFPAARLASMSGIKEAVEGRKALFGAILVTGPDGKPQQRKFLVTVEETT
jgi:hypothetical protein